MQEAGSLEKNSRGGVVAPGMEGTTQRKDTKALHVNSQWVSFHTQTLCVCVLSNHCISKSTRKLEKVNTLTRIRRFGSIHMKNTFSFEGDNEGVPWWLHTQMQETGERRALLCAWKEQNWNIYKQP